MRTYAYGRRRRRRRDLLERDARRGFRMIEALLNLATLRFYVAQRPRGCLVARPSDRDVQVEKVVDRTRRCRGAVPLAPLGSLRARRSLRRSLRAGRGGLVRGHDAIEERATKTTHLLTLRARYGSIVLVHVVDQCLGGIAGESRRQRRRTPSTVRAS